MARARQDSASQIMRRLKFDPLKYKIGVFHGTEDFDEQKMAIATELLPYAYGKARPPEIVLGSTAAGPIKLIIGGEDE